MPSSRNDAQFDLPEPAQLLSDARAAQARAEAASAAKSRLLADVSHEIRTPLNGILGMAELLTGTSLSAEQSTYVEAIRSSGAALTALIEEMLDFAQIEAGRLSVVATPFDVATLIEGVVELLAPRAQGKGLEIAGSIAADVPRRLIGDMARLRQTLLNLAGNAVKFTETGGVGVSVHATPTSVVFTVADTGPGVPETRRGTIFEAFERGDNVGAGDGTGLGLAISRRLAAHMGGHLELAASNAAGSAFVLQIPRRVEAAARPPADADTQSLTGQTAMLVADSPFEVPFLAARLAEAGLSVVTAASEAAGCARIATAPPDILIVDAALGEVATHRLGAAGAAAGIARRLVLVSPFERRAFAQGSVAGFDAWLVKPVRARSLFARLIASPPNESAVGRQPAAPRIAEGLEILLAEDNDINALLVTRHLEKLGAKVVRVADGSAAIALAEDALARRRARFAAAFLDIRMPALDGLAVARRIRYAEAAAGAPRLHLIALTADTSSAHAEAAFAAGIDAFLTKPVDFNRIARALKRCVNPHAPA